MSYQARGPIAWNQRLPLASSCLATALVLACSGSERAPHPAVSADGLVVEIVLDERAASRAGIRPGDEITSWVRLDSSARPVASGGLTNPFELDRIEREEAPLGVLRLVGIRDGVPSSFDLPPGVWELEAYPRWLDAKRARFEQGQTTLAQGASEAALATWEALVEELDPTTDTNTAWLLVKIGKEWAKLGRWQEAGQAFERAHEAATAAGSTLARALVRETEAGFYLGQREMQKTVASWQSAVDLYLEEDRHRLSSAYALRQLGQMQARSGRLEDGLASANGSVKVVAEVAPESLAMGRSLGLVGTIHLFQGDLSAAQRYLQQALEFEQRLAPASISAGGTLSNLAMIAFERGRLAEAEAYLRSNLDIATRLDPSGPRVASVLNNLANIAYFKGDLEQAVALVRRSLAIKRSTQVGADKLAVTLTNLAELQMEQEDFEAASKSFDEALELKRSVAPDSPSLALSLAGSGELESRRGNSAVAIELLTSAVEILERKAPRSLNLAKAEAKLAKLLREQRRLSDAEGRLLSALAIRKRLAPESAALAESLWELGRLQADQGRTRDAADSYLASIETLEAQRGYLGRSDQAGGQLSKRFSDLFREAIDLHIELDRAEPAFKILERSRAQSFLMLLAARDLMLDRRIPAELETRRQLARVAYDRTFAGLSRVNPNDESGVQAARSKLASIREEMLQIEHQIRSVDERTANLAHPRVLDFTESREALDANSALIAYSIGSERSWAFVVRAGQALAVRPIPAQAAEIGATISELRETIAEARSGATGERRRRHSNELLEGLYAQLIAPVESLLEGTERILIVADGPLHTLPFSALRRASGTYLIEEKSLHLASSATVYSELRSRPVLGSSDPEIAVFAEPIYRQSTGDSLAPLPASGDEARLIASSFPRAQLWLGAEATESRVKALEPDTRIVHFACHASLDERLPLESALALSSPQTGDSQENGLLQAWEVFEEVRLGAELVVLSSCRSAGGGPWGGEGLLGLTRAFHYAGARSIVASLWPVADGGTAPFMGRFYEHLGAQETIAESLRAVQREAISGELVSETGADLSSPYYWAAFRLVGAPG